MSKIIRFRCDFCGYEATSELPDKVELYYNLGTILDMSYELCTQCYKKLIRYINNEKKINKEDQK